ncbi:hypothetical protein [Blautia producta]|uniref:hypothetical protein n=1 Tax=Blautia producta TaxID=33035 RepID=UPI00210CDB0A|nr:hypothetical protein [Blautia producta]MCQ4744264.1 hypothetical protein [Blautia producta]
MNEYLKAQSGAMSFDDLAGHVVRLMNDMTSRIKNYVQSSDYENIISPYMNEYIFAGYDWLRKRFVVKTISCVVNNYKSTLKETDKKRLDSLLVNYSNYSQEIFYEITDYHYEFKTSKRTQETKVVQNGQINFENHFGQIAIIGDKREEFVQKLNNIKGKIWRKLSKSI